VTSGQSAFLKFTKPCLKPSLLSTARNWTTRVSDVLGDTVRRTYAWMLLIKNTSAGLQRQVYTGESET